MTDSVIDIIKRISPEFPVEDLLAAAGGRLWWVPSQSRPNHAEIKRLIIQDPCRDIGVIVRRYKVSRSFVYRVWRAA